MTPTKRLFQQKPHSAIKLEEPGKPQLYDVDRNLVAEVSAKCNIHSLAASLQGMDEERARETLRAFGKEAMETTIQLADTKYLERTGEFIERVARLTGISFPHRFQRYVELGLIALRPLDRWNVVESTRRKLVIQVYSCAIHQAIGEQGLHYQGLPCQALCLASFQAAAQKTGDSLQMEHRRWLPRDRMCEFSLAPE